VGGTGGGNLMGSPAVTNAPVGKNNMTGGGGGKTPGVPRNPEASRLRSMDLHKTLTQSSLDLEHDLAVEAKQLRKTNIDAGIDMNEIDGEIKSSVVKSQKDL
jgi:hypothetical protein